MLPITAMTILAYIDQDDEAYAMNEGKVLCALGDVPCMTLVEANRLHDGGREISRIGNAEDADAGVYAHTLYVGEDDLRCDGCGHVIMTAPTEQPAVVPAVEPVAPVPAVHEFAERPDGISAGLVLTVFEANQAWAELHGVMEISRYAPVPLPRAVAESVLVAMVKLYGTVMLRENDAETVTVWVTRGDAAGLRRGLSIALDVKASTGGVSSATAHVRTALNKIERLINE